MANAPKSALRRRLAGMPWLELPSARLYYETTGEGPDLVFAHRLGGSPESGSAIWETIQLARHQDRPYPLDYITRLFPDFEEMHGDRLYGHVSIRGVAGPARPLRGHRRRRGGRWSRPP